jgi:hypothetical protein
MMSADNSMTSAKLCGMRREGWEKNPPSIGLRTGPLAATVD